MLRGEEGVGGDVTFMAARIQREPTPVVLSRDTLFTGDYVPTNSDFHPDGDRLVVPRNVSEASGLGGDESERERFLVVVNCFEELLERLGN